MVEITERKREITATGAILITILFLGLAGQGGLGLESEHDATLIGGGEFFIDVDITNNYADAILVYPDNIQATDSNYNKHISSSDAFKETFVNETYIVKVNEEKTFICEYKIKEKTDNQDKEKESNSTNTTTKYKCYKDKTKDIDSKEEDVFNKTYDSFNETTNTFYYSESKDVEKQKKVKKKSKDGISIATGETETVRVYFSVPMNTKGKFDVEVDVYIDGELRTFILDPWYSSFIPYKQEIKILDNSNHAKTDYQIKLELTNASVGANFNWTNNGDDIRFLNSTENGLLDYYIYSWSSITETTTIWVEVDELTKAVNTSIFMYYGNTTYTARTNGYNTFLLFDDFSNPVSAINTTYWDVDAGAVNVLSGEMTYATGDEVASDNSWSVNTSSTARWKYSAISLYCAIYSGGYGGIYGLWSTNFSSPQLYGGNSYFRILTRKEGVTLTIGSDLSKDTNYHIHEIIRNDTATITYTIDGTLKGTVSNTAVIPVDDIPICWEVRAGGHTGTAVADWIYVRKYEYPEPTYFIGVEEEPISNLSTITWTGSYNTTINIDSHTFNWTTDQGATKCNLTLDGTWYNQTNASVAQTDWSQAVSSLSEGNYTPINVTCSDQYDSVTSDNVWLFYDILPVISWNWVDANTTIATTSTNPAVTTNVDTNCTLNFNGTETANATVGTSTIFSKTGLADGVYSTIIVTCEDAEGNENASTTSTLTVDTTGPTITWNWSTYENTTDNVDPIWVNVTSGEAISLCNISIDGAANTTMTSLNATYWYYSWTISSDGNRTVQAFCNDALGNAGATVTSWYNLDVTAPVVTWGAWAGLNTTTSYNITTLTLTTDEAANCTFYLNTTALANSTVGTESSISTGAQADGNYSNITAQCEDAYGNLGTVPQTVWWNVSYSPPDITFSLLGLQSFIDWRPASFLAQLIEPWQQNATAESCIITFTNTGAATPLYLFLDSYQGIDILCDDDYTVAGALNLTTSHQQLIANWDTTSVDVCCWANITADFTTSDFGTIGWDVSA